MLPGPAVRRIVRGSLGDLFVFHFVTSPLLISAAHLPPSPTISRAPNTGRYLVRHNACTVQTCASFTRLLANIPPLKVRYWRSIHWPTPLSVIYVVGRHRTMRARSISQNCQALARFFFELSS